MDDGEALVAVCGTATGSPFKKTGIRREMPSDSEELLVVRRSPPPSSSDQLTPQ